MSEQEYTKKPTIKDVAELAGVSISAVSYIINNSTAKKYSPETVRKVNEAAAALSYAPNNIARGMRLQKAHAFGVVSFWDFDNRVFIKTLEGISEQAAAIGYSTVLCPVKPCGIGEIIADDFSYIDYFKNRRVDGIILVSPVVIERRLNEAAHINKLKEAGVPNVIINGGTRLPQVNYFYFDFYKTTYTAVKYLIGLGHSEINYAAPTVDFRCAELDERRSGYADAMREHVLEPHIHDVRLISDDMLRSFKAVVTNKSETAKILLHRAISLGLDVPGDFSLVSANIENYSEHLYTPLTCVQIPFRRIGQLAVERLYKNITGVPEYCSMTLECEISEGKSARRIR